MTDIEELEALYAKATRGEWKQSSYDSSPLRQVSLHSESMIFADLGYGYHGKPQAEANAALIVALHNAFPTLLARIRAYEGALEEIRVWGVEHAVLSVERIARQALAKKGE